MFSPNDRRTVEAICAGKQLICTDLDGLKDHAWIGAKACPMIIPNLFALVARQPGSQPERQELARRLNVENLLAWRSLLAALG